MAFRRMSPSQFVFVGVLIVVLIGVFFLVRGSSSEIQLPVLAIMGVIGLLAVLTFMSVVFSNLGLTDPREALGLPSGSIRAVIALSLIVIFVISAIFLFVVLSYNSTSLQGLTTSQADAIPVSQLLSKTLSAGSTDRWDVTINAPVGQAATDFAKQLLTTLGALVTAITSFYFGTQSAQGPRPKPAPPSLSSIDPVSIKAVASGDPTLEVDFTAQGDNLLEVTQLLLMQGTQTISATAVTSNMNIVNATFEFSDANQGEFDVVAKTREGDSTRLPKAFKIEPPAPAING